MDSPSAGRPVRITRSQFLDNNDIGLNVPAFGPITLNTVTASRSKYSVGASLDTIYAPVPSAITILGVNDFSSNSGTGLYINSTGNVSVSGVTAANNGGIGVRIADGKTVMLTKVNASQNGWDGVRVNKSDSLTITALTSFFNGTTDAHNGLTVTTSGLFTLRNSFIIGNKGDGFAQTSGSFVNLNNVILGNLK